MPAEAVSVPVMIVHDKHFQIVPLTTPLELNDVWAGTGLNHISWLVSDWKTKHPQNNLSTQTITEQGNFGLDLLEVSFFRWMSWQYPSHWQLKHYSFPQLSYLQKVCKYLMSASG